MKIFVPINLVPDLVEELDIDESGTGLDMAWLRLIINEFDDHALEQAILLKEALGGQVTAIAPSVEGAEDMLFTASARGADQIIKLLGDFEKGVNSHALARAFVQSFGEQAPDLVLTGVQAHNDLDGSIGPLIAEQLGWPYVGYVAGVSVDNGQAVVRKEYPGGLIGEMKVQLPAVLGIESAENPPRYVAISKVRQAMKTVSIENKEIGDFDPTGGPIVSRMFQPEVGERATMLEGDEEEVAKQLIDIFKDLGIL